MRVFLSNVGCKLNQAENERLARDFDAAGFEVVTRLNEAELHVVNSCSVTTGAERDSRRALGRGRRQGTPLRTVLTGCWATSHPDAARAAGVDLVVPNSAKDSLVAGVSAAFPEAAVRRSGAPRKAQPPSRARAAVKIDDGCDVGCAFCIIPSTRGAQRSRPASEVVDDVARLHEAGHAEVILTGVQISSWSEGRGDLAHLVRRILDETSVARLRLTSIAPWELGPEILELYAVGRVCRHVHLSLQSGSVATLRRMRRPGSPASFARRVDDLRRRVAGIAITTDLIVGFPGETEDEFEESLAFVADQHFARVHAFPFSPRPGTRAETMGDVVAPERQRERMVRARELADRSAEAFVASQIGTPAEVLWESVAEGRWSGTTDNYVKVELDSGAARRGDLERVDLVDVRPGARALARRRA